MSSKVIDGVEAFPLHSHTDDLLISRNFGVYTLVAKMTLPEIYSLESVDLQNIQLAFEEVYSSLGVYVQFHKQHFFTKHKYTPNKEILNIDDPLLSSNEFHKNERNIMDLESYIYFSNIPKTMMKDSPSYVNGYIRKGVKSFFSSNPRDFHSQKGVDKFKSKVKRAIGVLNSINNIKVELIDSNEFNSESGPINKYYNLGLENELNDIDFSNGTVRAGRKIAKFYTLSKLEQFKSANKDSSIQYGRLSVLKDSPFEVSNLFPIGFKLNCEHIINEYVYVPNHDNVLEKFKKKSKNFFQFRQKHKNKDGTEELRMDDSNTIFSQQIDEYLNTIINSDSKFVFYHLNVLLIAESEKELIEAEEELSNAAKIMHIKLHDATIDRKLLFLAGIPGNGCGLPGFMYMPMSSDFASTMHYLEGEQLGNTSSAEGIQLINRVGKPVLVSLHKKPKDLGWITNYGTFCASGSGGGKSVLGQKILQPAYINGDHIVILEEGDSYEKFVELHNGIIIKQTENNIISSAPFALKEQDYIINEFGKKDVSLDKINTLIALIFIIGALTEKEDVEKFKVRTSVIRDTLYLYYKKYLENKDFELKFNTYYEFLKAYLPNYLEENRIDKSVFNYDNFIYLLKAYYKGGIYENLLNSDDPRLKNLSDERLIYFMLQGVSDNEDIYPLVIFMIIEIFSSKLYRADIRDIKKWLVADEVWKVLLRPEFEEYFNLLSRLARKYYGAPFYISQKFDDIVTEKLGKSIVVNSHTLLFLNLIEFLDSFDDIQNLLGINDYQKKRILSMEKDKVNDLNYKEVAICWKDRIGVYGVELSSEELCVYESDPTQVKRIRALQKRVGGNLLTTAKTYKEELKNLKDEN